VFDKENSIEFPLDSVHYLYIKSNPNPSFYPALLYESLSSRTSINKKIKEKKKKNDNQKLKEKKRKEILNNDLAILPSHDICIQGFSSIELGINFPAGCSVQFLFHWQASYVMNIEWDYNYYQPWSDNEWLVDKMLAMLNEDITMQ